MLKRDTDNYFFMHDAIYWTIKIGDGENQMEGV